MCMCKEVWFVGLGQEERVACMRGKLGQRVGSLKRGAGTSLRTMMWKFYCDDPFESY